MQRWSLAVLFLAWCSAQEGFASVTPTACEPTAINRELTNFTATGSGDHVVLSWHAKNFNIGSTFEAWRSIDGGVVVDSCATDQGGQCATVTFTAEGDYTLNDYGVKNNFKYSYLLLDSESRTAWFMAAPFQGSLTKPPAPSPASPPAVALGDLWTDGTTAELVVAIPYQGTPWAHKYIIRYYSDHDATIRTAELWGRPSIGLPLTAQPAWYPNRTYHITIQGIGMTSNTAESAEHHVKIFPAPDLYYAAVVAGTSISLQWTGNGAGEDAQYEVLYRKLSPDPPGDQLIVDAGTQRVWNISGLEEQSVYVVQVCAKDQWGHPSPPSNGRILQTGTASPTDAAGLPHSLGFRVFPVPFRAGGTLVSFRIGLPQAKEVDLGVYDVGGRLVRTVFRGTRNAGMHALPWDGRNDHGQVAAAGIYVARLRAGERILTQKLVLLR